MSRANRIPREVLHKVLITLLHSLEWLPNIDWKQLLKLQSRDGSFLFSPSSTAYALMQTKDGNAHKYLEKTVQRFNGGGEIFLINMLILLLFINFVSQNYEMNILIKEKFHFVQFTVNFSFKSNYIFNWIGDLKLTQLTFETNKWFMLRVIYWIK